MTAYRNLKATPFKPPATPARIVAKQPNLVELPIDFRSHRDTRTLLEIAGIKVLRILDEVPHNALDDADAQARAVLHAMSIVDNCMRPADEQIRLPAVGAFA